MIKKIIFPLVILIFTQYGFYGMNNEYNIDTKDTGPKIDEEQQTMNIWKTLDSYCNRERDETKKKLYPRFWLLWAIVDNVPFQYGNSKKIWKNGEAYYGLSNGIGFFPSFLNFGWVKIGFVDAHINVINLILDYFKNFIQLKYEKQTDILQFLLLPIFANLVFNIHIFSVKILNCIKIKLVAPLTLIYVADGMARSMIGAKEGEKKGTAWYITYNTDCQISWLYALLSPRIEINIAGIIDFKEK